MNPDQITLPETAPPARIVDEVSAYFESLGSPEDAAGVEHFIPGMDRTYGVRVPVMRKLGKKVARQYRDDPYLCKSIAFASWPRGTRENRLLSIFIIEGTRLPPEELWHVGVTWLPDIRTWEDCDQLCSATLSRALNTEPRYMDILESWVDSDHMWTRRAALVTTTYLRRARYDETIAVSLDERVLGMCNMLLNDEEKYIRKAVDWAVREVIKRHYDLGYAWLMGRAVDDLPRHARSTLKLSAKKLTDEDRAAFLQKLEV